MPIEGSCHCGAIRFEVDADPPAQVLECNCSFCRRQGHKWWYVPLSKLRLLTNPNAVSSYFFGPHKIEHHHCGVCGCSPYSEGEDPDKGQRIAAINARCLPSVDLDALEVQQFDGASL